MNKALRALQYLLVVAVSTGGVGAAVAQEEEESKRKNEIRYEITFSTTPPAEARCTASLEYEFRQKNTVAAVDTTITNADCGASRGEYTMRVRFRDESNELQTLEYPEIWQRDDDQPIKTYAEYAIGDNVDLISVGSRKIRCFCEASGAAKETPEE